MKISNDREDAFFIKQISIMSLSRNLSKEEQSFIDVLVTSVKNHKTLRQVAVPIHENSPIHLDSKLIHELVTQVKRSCQEDEEKVLLEFVKALPIQELLLIHDPLLRNYFTILKGFYQPLSDIVPDEKERIALAYSALHGTQLTAKVLKNHLEHFGIKDPKALENLQKKIQFLS